MMRKICFCVFFFPILMGCSPVVETNATPSGTPPFQTVSPSASVLVSPSPNPTVFPTIPLHACLLYQVPTIRTLRSQGDLMAWSPTSNVLAFLSSSEQMDQSSGSLMIVPLPAEGTTLRLATNGAGNISWSPDGKHIAFTSLRLGEGVYSLQAVATDGSGLVDFFPGDSARTDEWASPKIVHSWSSDNQHLEIYASCGVNCAAPYIANVLDGTQKPAGGPGLPNIDFWQIHTYTPETLPESITDATSPNWSPDGNRIAYFDDRFNIWVLSKTEKNQFMLDLGKWATPYETKWSSDGNYLAVRVDLTIKVFQIGCEPAP
jgi:dipeptidyl aminopeptidase/acylaminoacyl peptidase